MILFLSCSNATDVGLLVAGSRRHFLVDVARFEDSQVNVHVFLYFLQLAHVSIPPLLLALDSDDGVCLPFFPLMRASQALFICRH